MKSVLFSAFTRYALPVAMVVHVCVWPMAAWAEDWVFLRNNDQGEAMFLDTASIVNRSNYKGEAETAFTVKHRYPTEQVSGDLRYWESLHYMSINCGGRLVSEEEQQALDSNGQVIASWSIYDDYDYGPGVFSTDVYIPPGSPGDQGIGMVCTPQ